MSDHWTYKRDVGDGLSVFVLPMIFNDRLVVGETDSEEYIRGFCFPKGQEAIKAAATWDGDGDPSGPWIKEAGTNRYRVPGIGQEGP